MRSSWSLPRRNGPIPGAAPTPVPHSQRQKPPRSLKRLAAGLRFGLAPKTAAAERKRPEIPIVTLPLTIEQNRNIVGRLNRCSQMTLTGIRPFRLVLRGEPGLSCDEDGVALAGVQLVRAAENLGQADVRRVEELWEILRLAYGPQSPDVVQRCHRGLRRAAAQLEAGDIVRASLEAVMIGFPDLAPRAVAKLAALAENITVNNRDVSSRDLSYRIPDARLGNVSIDWTLIFKTISTPQIRGFFQADSEPDAVVIIRPSQLGRNSTYLIRRPANRMPRR